MAEETKGNETVVEQGGAEPIQQQGGTGGENRTPDVNELMSQLAAEKAEKERLKAAADKAASDAANYKKALRAKQTTEEQEAEAKAEAERKAAEELETLRKELNHNKAVNAYKSLSSEKTVETLIDAVSDADHAAIATIIDNEIKAAVKEAEAKWLKERPRVNAGQYSSMTKEQILAIADRDERRKAIAMNMDLFQ